MGYIKMMSIKEEWSIKTLRKGSSKMQRLKKKKMQRLPDATFGRRLASRMVLCQTSPWPRKMVLKTDSTPTKRLANDFFVLQEREGVFLDGIH